MLDANLAVNELNPNPNPNPNIRVDGLDENPVVNVGCNPVVNLESIFYPVMDPVHHPSEMDILSHEMFHVPRYLPTTPFIWCAMVYRPSAPTYSLTDVHLSSSISVSIKENDMTEKE